MMFVRLLSNVMNNAQVADDEAQMFRTLTLDKRLRLSELHTLLHNSFGSLIPASEQLKFHIVKVSSSF